MNKSEYVTDATFESEVLKSEIPVLVDFYADWCGPCRVLDQTLLKLATTRDDVAIRKVNIVNYKSPVAKQFLRRVRGIPYLLVFDKNHTLRIGTDAQGNASHNDVPPINSGQQ